MFSFFRKKRTQGRREADLISGSVAAGHGDIDPLTATRMNDHNVRGRASDPDEDGTGDVTGDDGRVSEFEMIRISSYDLPAEDLTEDVEDDEERRAG
jgi:hypothetical protein